MHTTHGKDKYGAFLIHEQCDNFRSAMPTKAVAEHVSLAVNMHAGLHALVVKIANLKTDSEHGEDGISNDDAVDTLNDLIKEARDLYKG